MKKYFLLLLLIGIFVSGPAQDIRIMLVTGGHSYDTLRFFQMFDAMEGIEYEHFPQPEANKKLTHDRAKDFDLVVFYDMWENIGIEAREAYRRMGEEGKPFLFLHHSLASYQTWPEFEKIIGGRFVTERKGIEKDDISTYEHDVWVYSSVEKFTPVTAGFRELRFFDEVYGNVIVSESIVPLLRTRHPQSMDFIAWENRYRNSRVIYIQPGHDKRTYTEPDYRKLLFQAIHYLAKK